MSIGSTFWVWQLTSKTWGNASNPGSKSGKALPPSEKSTGMQQTSTSPPFPDPTDLHQRRLLISINQSSIFQDFVPSEQDSWYSGEPAPLMWLSKALTQTRIMYEVPRWHSLFQYFKNSQISWIVCLDFHTIQLQWKSATLYPIEEAFLLYNWGHRMSSPEAYPMSLLWVRSSQRDFYISLKQWQMIRMKYVSSRYSDLIKPFLTNFNYILI